MVSCKEVLVPLFSRGIWGIVTDKLEGKAEGPENSRPDFVSLIFSLVVLLVELDLPVLPL